MIEHSATLSDCGKYRYDLKRIWDHDRTYVLWIGLNPSTADASEDDPTICKMMGFARKWQHGGIVVCNLFACRSTEPNGIKRFADPVGPDNDKVIREYTRGTKAYSVGNPRIVCCWGNHGALHDRDLDVFKLFNPDPYFREPECLGYTQHGHPKHPARIAYATPLTPFSIRRK